MSRLLSVTFSVATVATILSTSSPAMANEPPENCGHAVFNNGSATCGHETGRSELQDNEFCCPSKPADVKPPPAGAIETSVPAAQPPPAPIVVDVPVDVLTKAIALAVGLPTIAVLLFFLLKRKRREWAAEAKIQRDREEKLAADRQAREEKLDEQWHPEQMLLGFRMLRTLREELRANHADDHIGIKQKALITAQLDHLETTFHELQTAWTNVEFMKFMDSLNSTLMRHGKEPLSTTRPLTWEPPQAANSAAPTATTTPVTT